MISTHRPPVDEEISLLRFRKTQIDDKHKKYISRPLGCITFPYWLVSWTAALFVTQWLSSWEVLILFLDHRNAFTFIYLGAISKTTKKSRLVHLLQSTAILSCWMIKTWLKWTKVKWKVATWSIGSAVF